MEAHTDSISLEHHDPSLLELIGDVRGLPESFSGTSVPEQLMEIPVTIASSWLDHHGRRCRRPANCADTPGPLRRFLKVHSRGALRAASPKIRKELFDKPNTPLARKVKSKILERERDISAEIGPPQGAILARLRDEPAADRPLLVARVAAVLWAQGLDDEGRHELFRFLPLVLPETPSNVETEPARGAPSRPFQEKERHKRRRLEAETRIGQLESDLETTKAKLRDRTQALRVANEALETTRGELKAERETATAGSDEREAAVERARAAERSLATLRRDAGRIERANRGLRELQRGFEKRLADTERDQRRVAAALATANARREEAEVALRTIPRGAEAIAMFLADEEMRLDQALLINQGGDRQRAIDQHARLRKLKRAFREAFPEYVPPRPRSIGETEEMRFTALGGGAEVGRSAYLLEIGDNRVMVDCGIAVGRDLEDGIPDIDGVGSLDAVIISHAHTDHIGWLPALIAGQDPDMPIYCSEDTAQLVPIMLRDAHDHYRRQCALKRRNAAHNPFAEPIHEHYTADDVTDIETRLCALRYDERRIGAAGFAITLFPAGHILGAASVLVERSDRRVLFSGDISSEHQATVNAPKPPVDLEPVDLLVLESTYGDRTRENRGKDELVSFVQRATQQGTALLPCFALGRGQEVLRILLDAREAGVIDSDVTFWVDGLIRKILPVYVDRGLVPTEGYEIVGADGCSRDMAIGNCQRPDAKAAVITTSGMLNGGPVVPWADALLRDSRHRLALLGYQDEKGSLGGRLRELRDKTHPPYNITLTRDDGDETPLRINGPICDIGLSAHADQSGLVRFAQGVPTTRIALVHGDRRSQERLAARLSHELPNVDVCCSGRATITIQ